MTYFILYWYIIWISFASPQCHSQSLLLYHTSIKPSGILASEGDLLAIQRRLIVTSACTACYVIVSSWCLFNGDFLLDVSAWQIFTQDESPTNVAYFPHKPIAFVCRMHLHTNPFPHRNSAHGSILLYSSWLKEKERGKEAAGSVAKPNDQIHQLQLTTLPLHKSSDAHSHSTNVPH